MWWKTCVNKTHSDSQTFFPTAFIYYGPVKLQRPFQIFVANILEPRFCVEIVYSFPEILVNWFCKYSKALAVCLMLNRKYSDSCFSLCYLFSFWSWCLTKETFHQVWAVNSFFHKIDFPNFPECRAHQYLIVKTPSCCFWSNLYRALKFFGSFQLRLLRKVPHSPWKVDIRPKCSRKL